MKTNIDSLTSLILEQNPWLSSGKVPEHFVPPTERPMGKYLWRYVLDSSKHLIILGARRVGKTTVMYQTVKHLLNEKIPVRRILWVRLDHPELMNIPLKSIVEIAINLSKATLDQPVFLFLDELVYAENWDLWLKTFYDEKWPVQIIASSSATASLRNRRRESGIGRWEEIYLAPYLLNELLELQEKELDISSEKHLRKTIEQIASSPPVIGLDFEQGRKSLMSLGGFPEILSNQWVKTKSLIKDIKRLEELEKKSEENEERLERLKQTQEIEKTKEEIRKIKEATIKIKRTKELDVVQIRGVNFYQSQKTLRSDAIERAIYKDITQSYRIDNSMALERLLYTLAGQITGLLSFKGISKDIFKITVQTLERYLSYLIESYLVFTLLNYAKNEGSVQRRGRKVYFVDGAVRNSALHKTENEIFNNPVELGKLQENLVAAHLRALGEQANVRFYHWRWKKYEVDFIYDDHSYPLALEIGSSSGHTLVSLKEFLKEHPKFHGGCYYVAPGINFSSAEASEAGIGQMPLDLLLLATGIQQKEALKTRLNIFEENN